MVYGGDEVADFPLGDLVEVISDAVRAYRVKLYGTAGDDVLEVKTNTSGELKIDGAVALKDASGFELFTGDNPGNIELNSSNTLIYNSKVSWVNSSPSNTTKIIDIGLPEVLKTTYLVIITNPSAETDLSVSVRNEFTDSDSAVRYAELVDITVLKNYPDGLSFLIDGAIFADGLRLVLSNDTVVGPAGAFSSYVQIRQV